MRQKLIRTFETCGIYLTENESQHIVLDSLQYVSLLVCIEEDFNIEIPDSYIEYNMLSTFQDYLEMIKTTLNGEEVTT